MVKANAIAQISNDAPDYLSRPYPSTYTKIVDIESFDTSVYFKNHIYIQPWGYALLSLNYQRFFPEQQIAIGMGFGLNTYARNFTLGGDGGGMLNIYFLRQFSLSEKYKIGFGGGSTYDFTGWYNNFEDPLFLKVNLSRYSITPDSDIMYAGISLYYIKWGNWSLRPSFSLGFSF